MNAKLTAILDHAKLAAVLERRILRLNQEYAAAKREGCNRGPFKRRARSLTDAWRKERE